jgi:hypothetical protein
LEKRTIKKIDRTLRHRDRSLFFDGLNRLPPIVLAVEPLLDSILLTKGIAPMNDLLFRLLFPIICLFALHSPTPGASRCECFPTERLPADLRVKSEALLLKALDSEALYTIIGGLKPMSSGIASFKFSVEKPDLAQIEETRRLLSVWRCGNELFADVQHFAAIYDDEKTREKFRFADAIVFNLPALDGKIGEYAEFFAPYGITPNAHPMEVLTTIEYSQPNIRWRGYGYLFGFPLYAVDFFVTAG